MAQLTIIINNTIAADVRDTLCAAWGYAGDPSDNAAKLEFVRAYTAAWIKDSYRARKSTLDGEIARINTYNTLINIDIV